MPLKLGKLARVFEYLGDVEVKFTVNGGLGGEVDDFGQGYTGDRGGPEDVGSKLASPGRGAW
jgi:hypothetical protein